MGLGSTGLVFDEDPAAASEAPFWLEAFWSTDSEDDANDGSEDFWPRAAVALAGCPLAGADFGEALPWLACDLVDLVDLPAGGVV